MASPQLEDGNTRIANELLEAITRFDIPGAELRILLLVARKTYGWQKNRDNISLSQFSKETNMTKTRIIRAIRNLVRYGVLGSIRGDTSNSSTYWIIKDYDKWTVASIKRDTSIIGDTTPSIIRDKKLVSRPQIVIQQKKVTKEILKKVSSPTKEAQDFFYKQHLEVMGEPYVANFGKDGMIFKNILNVLPVDRVKQLITYFFKSEDEFIRKAGYTTGVFQSQINKLKSPGGMSTDLLELKEMMENAK